MSLLREFLNLSFFVGNGTFKLDAYYEGYVARLCSVEGFDILLIKSLRWMQSKARQFLDSIPAQVLVQNFK